MEEEKFREETRKLVLAMTELSDKIEVCLDFEPKKKKRIRCSVCSRDVSSLIPADAVIDAWTICPECYGDTSHSKRMTAAGMIEGMEKAVELVRRMQTEVWYIQLDIPVDKWIRAMSSIAKEIQLEASRLSLQNTVDEEIKSKVSEAYGKG